MSSVSIYNEIQSLRQKKKVTDITKLSGYPRSNVETSLEHSNYYLASGRFPLQNVFTDITLSTDVTSSYKEKNGKMPRTKYLIHTKRKTEKCPEQKYLKGNSGLSNFFFSKLI